jgi:hypothetical protein
MSVEHYQCFTRFRRLVEDRFEVFLQGEGKTTSTLVGAITRVRDRSRAAGGSAADQKAGSDEDEDDGDFEVIESSASLLLDCLSAADDYEVFVDFADEGLQLLPSHRSSIAGGGGRSGGVDESGDRAEAK